MVNTLTFTDMQKEYGDISLVDSAISRMGWVFPVKHPVQRAGFYPHSRFTLDLQQATKLIGHSDWRRGWFRPDIWGWHMNRVIAEIGLECELLNPPGRGAFCHIRVGQEEWKTRRKPDCLNAVRLLYLSSLVLRKEE